MVLDLALGAADEEGLLGGVQVSQLLRHGGVGGAAAEPAVTAGGDSRRLWDGLGTLAASCHHEASREATMGLARSPPPLAGRAVSGAAGRPRRRTTCGSPATAGAALQRQSDAACMTHPSEGVGVLVWVWADLCQTRLFQRMTHRPRR